MGGEPSDPDSSEDDDYFDHERQSIPDESLWKMFVTGVPFRTLSTILNEAFEISGNRNQFYTSQTHLFNKYKQIHAQKELEYKESISANNSLGSICFDHQKMRMIQGKYEGTVDRLATVWHSDGKDNILGMSKMPDKKGESQALVIQNYCQNYANAFHGNMHSRIGMLFISRIVRFGEAAIATNQRKLGEILHICFNVICPLLEPIKYFV